MISSLKSTIKTLVNEVKPALGLRCWVRVIVKRNQDYYTALIGGTPTPLAILVVDTDCEQFSKQALRGLVAHELAHFFTSDEVEADTLALEAGFQDALIAFHKEHNKTYEEYHTGEGLTLKEIKRWTPKQ